MIPFKYLDIPNHTNITLKIRELILTSLYYNTRENGDIIFTFTPQVADQKKYDIHTHSNFWNYLDLKEVLYLVPELNDVIYNLKIIPYCLNLIVITNDYIALHSDAGPINNNTRINWPIYNCNPATKTIFYKLKNNQTIDTNYKPPAYEREQNSDEIFKTAIYDADNIENSIGHYILTQPILFDYTIPHSISTPNEYILDYPRILMSIDFDSDSLKL